MGFLDKLLTSIGIQSDESDQGYKQSSNKQPLDCRSFDEKLQKIIEFEGCYELKRDIPISSIEQELGQEIYARKTNYCAPEDISYAIFHNEQRVMFIRLWEQYNIYNRVTNRQIANFCKENGIICLDFFDYLPNDFDYMMDRIRTKLVS